ncbi:hypothetical protein [Schleiferilactobacillus perolens]|uniref:hypothetical protein n=1 Tax=Schleiferilactobacillus perolens TaxID=100468 RepID=UPI001F312860|nr:hypothetical protein [Schleiferilactobacillus perolens]
MHHDTIKKAETEYGRWPSNSWKKVVPMGETVTHRNLRRKETLQVYDGRRVCCHPRFPDWSHCFASDLNPSDQNNHQAGERSSTLAPNSSKISKQKAAQTFQGGVAA